MRIGGNNTLRGRPREINKPKPLELGEHIHQLVYCKKCKCMMHSSTKTAWCDLCIKEELDKDQHE